MQRIWGMAFAEEHRKETRHSHGSCRMSLMPRYLSIAWRVAGNTYAIPKKIGFDGVGLWIVIHSMNESYSAPVPHYRRWQTPLLQAAQRDHPVVVLTGARQVGKSTLLLNADPFRTWRFSTLDDLETRRQAREAPESLWAGAEGVLCAGPDDVG